jgi:hypothetical protein
MVFFFVVGELGILESLLASSGSFNECFEDHQ